MHCRRWVVAGFASVSLAAAAFSLSGCNIYRPGGSLRSNDTFTYIANEHMPLTVTLMDTRVNEPVWTGCKIAGRRRL